MNLNRQIKKYRERDHLSQEDLAEKKYVSRQTISNWENERSYPDIHNLLLMSTVFDVSLDELVKGDLEMMKNTIEQDKMNKLSLVMLLFLVLACISFGPAYHFFGRIGLFIPFFLWVIGMTAALRMEKIKKDNNIKTYAEIVAFLENRDLDKVRENRDKRKNIAELIVAVVLFALIGAGIAALSMGIF